MKTVFLDIDTQVDFMYPAGALYAPGAETIIPNVAALTQFAAQQGHPIVASVDAHSEDDPEFKVWKPHCVVETIGQLKIRASLLDNPLVVSSAPDALAQLIAHLPKAKQIVVEKQVLDCFSNPHLAGLLETLGAKAFIVYGVATEYCVRCAIEGLLGFHKPVYLVTDAVRSINAFAGDQLIHQFAEEGVEMVTTAEVTSGRVTGFGTAARSGAAISA